ncbi:hypothetical protein GCM10023116_10030 [Kistimonas scapharcae]|uniref:Solute-binding protein family 3/N-terminal domain-containing protein n=1 Tax=Kistimonas scapharcae TaxID=1036133 RepID=A0ABP8V046_9GAMM
MFTPAYFELTVGIIANQQKGSISNIEEILSDRVGTVSGYASEEILRRQYPEADIASLKSPQDGLLKLGDGEIDYFIDYVLSSTYYSRKMSLPELKVVGLTKLSLPLSIASRKDEPILAAILAKGQATITRKEVNNIILHWMENATHRHPSPLMIVGVILAVLIIIALMAMLWRHQQADHQ